MAAPIGQGKWMQSAVGFGGYPVLLVANASMTHYDPP